jgi:hypothetical protein
LILRLVRHVVEDVADSTVDKDGSIDSTTRIVIPEPFQATSSPLRADRVVRQNWAGLANSVILRLT